MPSFFDKPFEEQVEGIIKTENEEGVRLLQALIGIRHPIAFTQYYSSFIITKINIINAKLYSLCKLKKLCLKEYTESIGEYIKSKGEIIDEVELRKFLSKKVKPIKDEGERKVRESVLEISNQEYVEYMYSTNIAGLCAMNGIQATGIYNSVAKEIIEEIDQKIVSAVTSKDFEKMKEEINKQLKDATEKYRKYSGEISKYQNFIKSIKDHTFLSKWYSALLEQVKKDSSKRVEHVLHNHDTSRLNVDVSNWLIDKIFDKVLDNKLEELKKKHYLGEVIVEHSLGKKYLKEKVLKISNTSILNPKEFIDTMQNIPDGEVRGEKEKLSQILINEIDTSLIAEEKRALREVLPKAIDTWKESKSRGIKVKDFLVVILEILGHSIKSSKFNQKNSFCQLQHSREILLESLQSKISEILSVEKENFLEKLLAGVLKRREYHSSALILLTQLIKPHNVIEAEQEILNTILIKAIEADKQDIALLLICNGADIDESHNVITKLGCKSLEAAAVKGVACLYNTMPKIRIKYTKGEIESSQAIREMEFIVDDAISSNKEEIVEIYEIFNLEEFNELFPKGSFLKEGSNITMDYREKVTNTKLPRIKSRKQKNKTEDEKEKSTKIVEQDEKGMKQIEKGKMEVGSLKQTTQYLENKERKRLAIGWSISASFGGLGGGVCAFLFLPPPIAALVLAGTLASSVVSCLIGFNIHIFVREQGDLEISRNDLQDLNKAIDFFTDLLNHRAASGVSDAFLKEIKQEKENINASKEDFLSLTNISNIIKRTGKAIPGIRSYIAEFKEKKWKDVQLITLLLGDFETELDRVLDKANEAKEITFGEMAKNIIKSREKYIRRLKAKDKLDEQNDTEEKLKVIERKTSDAIVKSLSADRQKEKRAKEQEERKKEKAYAREKATDLLYDKIYELNISAREIMCNQDARERLKNQCTLLVLNMDYEVKFKDICSQYKEFKNELKHKQFIGEEELNRLSELADKLCILDDDFTVLKHKMSELNLQFENEILNKLETNIIEEMKRAGTAAEQEREVLREEKEIVEEMVMQLQRSESTQPNFALDEVRSIIGPSWSKQE
ncbi:Ankyrin repeat-containing domain [Cinara cedri]|uniref:Ankyrin repeat-containing domain n=1 Tax=Cinara cedri TaxID=506608 RepID=A0A5E4M9M2_9HEMI|nr:Ankyrin repeat-containing domain [Cinara cedri]